MANYNQVSKLRAYNPYVCNKRKIVEMVFFADNEIIATHKQGWLAENNNNDGNTAIEEIKFRSRRNPKIDINESHQVGDVLYICTHDLIDFKLEKNAHICSREYSDRYADNISFVTGGSASQFSHIQEVKYRTYMLSGTGKSVPNEKGLQVEKLEQAFKDLGIDIEECSIKRMFKHKDEVVNALTNV